MIYLGLGSNQGARRHFLSEAIRRLGLGGFDVIDISPVVESPALLADDAPPEWNEPYLNLVISGRTGLSPHATLKLAKAIEQELGRDPGAPRWSPRNIDIDLLLWNDERIASPELTIPHTEMHKRSFVITPLTHLVPNLRLPVLGMTPLQISEQIRPIPLWMGVVNLTPDSFSDGGINQGHTQLIAKLDEWVREGVQILDFGGESTRPGAVEPGARAEWRRLAPAFELISELRRVYPLMPIISVDTRHPEVADKALQSGADWINDVTGLSDPAMLEVLRRDARGGVAMHSLSVPVKPGEALDSKRPVGQQLVDWLLQRKQTWLDAGLSLDRLLFDPGVGFGKTALQNMDIIRSTARLRSHGFRLLVGHSRKSFMNSFTAHDFGNRDIETLGLSLAMCEQGVDVLRVHDPLAHIRAYRAWSQARAVI